MHDASDTIAAIATPPGPGGIAVLRISGPEAARVLSSLFRPSACAGPPDAFVYKPRFLHHGQALDTQGRRLDEALAVFMPGPRSFTGEDVAEIHCHGGRGVTAALLEAALRAGARSAGPGEFTRRAFLNGRLDLTQAEAVAEMISAPTREGARLASAKLDGLLSREIAAVRGALDALRAQAILAVDFPDEDAELLPRQAFGQTLRDCSAAVRRLVNAFERARLWREGASAVLAGRVNTGKSSLLNALLGRERAIVSARPGTTRDYIEESINLSGLPLRLVDTAGLRGGGDVDGTEREGMRRSGDLAEEADLLIFVSDITALPHPDEGDFLRRHWARLCSGRLMLIINKIDLLEDDDAGRAARVLEKARALLSAAAPPGISARDMAKTHEQCPTLGLSAKTGSGLELLAKGMAEALRTLEGKAESGETDVAPNLRQSLLLRETLDEFGDLEAALAAGLPADILAVHLEAAAQKLDQVTGSSCNEELLDRIFASFCIGK